MTHLENYLDYLKGFPNEVQRGLALVYTLDVKAHEIQSRLERNQDALLSLCKAPLAQQGSTDEDLKHKFPLPLPQHAVTYLRAIREDQRQVYYYSQEKIAAMKEVQDLVAGYTAKLDLEIDKFERELGTKAPESDAYDYDHGNRTKVEKKSSAKSSHDAPSLKRPPERRLQTPSVKKQHTEETQQAAELFCFCRQVSFGEMIGCDHDSCRLEWFHFQCVGLTRKPKGKWYCDECKIKIERGG